MAELTGRTNNLHNALNNLVNNENIDLTIESLYELMLRRAREHNRHAFSWLGDTAQEPRLIPLPLPGLQPLILPDSVHFPETTAEFNKLCIGHVRAILRAYEQADKGILTQVLDCLQRFICAWP
ncbi:uncharacterized protein FOMMEDRAFT_162695 [Fomitiporia mediterranea MF3/22]|uniref:Uncharacterized protein n=1 Tax=Fomitiporia mediterranea (strain MF3/22) TaxID=694068 RepID=R7SG27_FOMME|nr:uncharacterized protein FOMMEDRAFT_162695 [Fomitiporia mediterranea MF3/22]EJC97671.1 hypothetical protein FOMMEDRAFT_162695 [Fomitiporia mediterranea MF3/22]